MTRSPRRNPAPQGWVVKEWGVKHIIAESPTMFRVQWDGLDPKTQTPWKPTWEYKQNVNTAATAHWESLKARRAERKRGENKDTIDAMARWKVVDQGAPEGHGEPVIAGGASSPGVGKRDEGMAETLAINDDENLAEAPLSNASYSQLGVEAGVNIVLNATGICATTKYPATKVVASGYVSNTTITTDIEGEHSAYDSDATITDIVDEHSEYDSDDSGSIAIAGEDDPDWSEEGDSDASIDEEDSSNGSTSAIDGYILTTSYKTSPLPPTQDTITCAILCQRICELRQQLDSLVDIHMVCEDGEYKDEIFRRAEALLQLIDGAKGAFLLAKGRIDRHRIEGNGPEREGMA